jgi:hypothetical protein
MASIRILRGENPLERAGDCYPEMLAEESPKGSANLYQFLQACFHRRDLKNLFSRVIWLAKNPQPLERWYLGACPCKLVR